MSSLTPPNGSDNQATSVSQSYTSTRAPDSKQQVESKPLTFKGSIKEFFTTVPYIGFLSGAGALSAYAFTAISPMQGALLLGCLGTVTIISFIACKLLLNVTDNFAMVSSVITGLCASNLLAKQVFPMIGYKALTSMFTFSFVAGTTISTLIFIKIFNR